MNLNCWRRTFLAELLAQSEMGQSFAAGSLPVVCSWFSASNGVIDFKQGLKCSYAHSWHSYKQTVAFGFSRRVGVVFLDVPKQNWECHTQREWEKCLWCLQFLRDTCPTLTTGTSCACSKSCPAFTANRLISSGCGHTKPRIHTDSE